MSSYQFAPTPFPPRGTERNYVFVDEHNRHKRLKVMRACEGCRRRKIKCDSATTNSWPCSACKRLKLHCVKPNNFETADPTTYDAGVDPSAQFQQNAVPGHIGSGPSQATVGLYPASFQHPDSSAFHQMAFDLNHHHHYTTVPPSSVPDPPYDGSHAFPVPALHQAPRQESSPSAHSADSCQQQDLADLLGGLRVNEIGTAPYLRNKASFRREEQPPLVEDDDEDYGSILRTVADIPGHKIRIPPNLMPDESTASHYLKLFFRHVHPYVPVLDKVAFYQEWESNRDAISPLILEALFAIGGRLAEEAALGQPWLALAEKHVNSFMDTPRLSTLQAMLLILKAREAAPKRSYFYRSWTFVGQCARMGKDLGLDEHYEDHEAEIPCRLSAAECHLWTRIWQIIYVCETMVGGPQGRHDLTVSQNSVDFRVPSLIPGGDADEYHVSRNFTYLARNVRNITMMSKTYAKLKRTKDWAVNPEFRQLERNISAYFSDLPSDMTITYPPDGSCPFLPSSFLGNLHSYYHLVRILYHRPVLSFLDPTTDAAQWKHHMSMCYDAAKSLCRLQEAILNSYGLVDLQSMQRGYSFTLYAGLSCIVIHLVAIVSPDPELNSDAREYFQRHMRLMETVMEAWPMADLQKQVDAIRMAFSADIRRPFVLKPSFPYGSPHLSDPSSSPPRGLMAFPSSAHQAGQMGRHLEPSTQHVSYINQPITPSPTSVGHGDIKSDSPGLQSLVMIPQDGQDLPGLQPTAGMVNNPPTWNPARIFEQWNSSFGTPSQPGILVGSNAPTPLKDSFSQGVPQRSSVVDMTAGQSQPRSAGQISNQQHYSTAPMTNSFITPAMWQESVASVYEGALKRSWDYDAGSDAAKRR